MRQRSKCSAGRLRHPPPHLLLLSAEYASSSPFGVCLELPSGIGPDSVGEYLPRQALTGWAGAARAGPPSTFGLTPNAEQRELTLARPHRPTMPFCKQLVTLCQAVRFVVGRSAAAVPPSRRPFIDANRDPTCCLCCNCALCKSKIANQPYGSNRRHTSKFFHLLVPPFRNHLSRQADRPAARATPSPRRSPWVSQRANARGHRCWTRRLLAGLKNGELLQAAEAQGFDVFLTGDQTLAHEQNLSGRRLAVVALSAIQLPIIRERTCRR